MELPDDLRYSRDHEWVRVEGEFVRVGITGPAAEALGEVVFARVEGADVEVVADGVVGELESHKAVSDIHVPLGGRVVEVNQRLAGEPGLVSSDPYGLGWVCVLRPSDTADLDGLLDAEEYRRWVDEGAAEAAE